VACFCRWRRMNVPTPPTVPSNCAQ
jgi:hypothetical protein